MMGIVVICRSEMAVVARLGLRQALGVGVVWVERLRAVAAGGDGRLLDVVFSRLMFSEETTSASSTARSDPASIRGPAAPSMNMSSRGYLGIVGCGDLDSPPLV